MKNKSPHCIGDDADVSPDEPREAPIEYLIALEERGITIDSTTNTDWRGPFYSYCGESTGNSTSIYRPVPSIAGRTFDQRRRWFVGTVREGEYPSLGYRLPLTIRNVVRAVSPIVVVATGTVALLPGVPRYFWRCKRCWVSRSSSLLCES